MPVEIDPEVAELLDDLPPIAIPQPLINKGWGQTEMDDHPDHTVSPSEVQQPTFDHHCLQCGRPVTAQQGSHWTDHVGRTECDHAITDQPWNTGHVISGVKEAATIGERIDQVLKKAYLNPITGQLFKPTVLTPKPVICSATRSSVHVNAHMHVCFHPQGHFGFHECKECRHLWWN